MADIEGASPPPPDPVAARDGGGPEEGMAFVARRGEGPPILFVHGSVVGAGTWKAQRRLGKRWTTLVLDRRGFGRSPEAERDDFEVDAADITGALGEGAHLVAHSYGAIGAMLAAAGQPGVVRSLTLVEPVAYSVAIGEPAVQQAVVDLIEYGTTGPLDPRNFLDGFLRLMGMPMDLPEELPPSLEGPTRLLMASNPPFAARIRLERLAAAGIPTLVVSGGHSDVFDAICDRLEERLGAERVVVPGAKHAIPSAGADFNEALERFLVSVDSS